MLRREVQKPPSRVDAAIAVVVVFAVLRILAGLAALLLGACGIEQGVKDIGADVAEVSYCEVADCGQVFLCTMPDATKNEWCWEDDSAAELELASGASSCSPTPRGGALGWPCLYCCGPKCGRGANAYMGSYCQ